MSFLNPARYPLATARLKALLALGARLLQKYPWAIATIGFVSGAASFFLVEREQEKFAQILSVLMLASWAWLALEKLLRRGISHWFGFELPPPLLSFVTQMVHQESLFFVIPFFFITTAWNTGQAVFTSILILFAVLSIIDPIYYRWIAAQRWRYFIFHGFTLFAVLLTALPIIFYLPTPKTYLLALGAAIILSLPGIIRALRWRWWWRALFVVAIVALTASIGLYTRTWIPPATLRLTKVAVTDQIDVSKREPTRALKVITDEQLKSGLYAYTAIRAPRGLQERIYHEWRLNGRTIDRIALDINGGREEGYRAWTHKLNFPPYPTGKWEIHVLTEANQVIGIFRFTVVKAHRAQPAVKDAPIPIQPEAGTDADAINENISVEINEPQREEIQEIIEEPQTIENNEPAEAEINEPAEIIESVEPAEANEPEIEIMDSSEEKGPVDTTENDPVAPMEPSESAELPE